MNLGECIRWLEMGKSMAGYSYTNDGQQVTLVSRLFRPMADVRVPCRGHGQNASQSQIHYFVRQSTIQWPRRRNDQASSKLSVRSRFHAARQDVVVEP